MPDAPAPAAPATPATPAAPATPAPNAVSEAARTLAAARKSFEDRLDNPEPAKPVEKPPEVKPEPEKPKEAPTDEILTLARKDRELKQREKALADREAQLKATEPTLARWRAAEEAAGKGDFLGAVRALGLTKEQLYEGNSSLFWALGKLAEEAPGQEDKPDVASQVAAELEKRKKEDEERQAKGEEAQEVENNRQRRIAARDIDREVLEALKADKAKYPNVVKARGIPTEQIVNVEYVGRKIAGWVEVQPDGREVEHPGLIDTDDRYFNHYVTKFAKRFERANGYKPDREDVEAHLAELKRPGFYQAFAEHYGRRPTPEETLAHFEQSWAAHGGAGAPAAEPERPASPQASVPKAPDGRITSTERPKNLAEAKARIEAELEQMERQRRAG